MVDEVLLRDGEACVERPDRAALKVDAPTELEESCARGGRQAARLRQRHLYPPGRLLRREYRDAVAEQFAGREVAQREAAHLAEFVPAQLHVVVKPDHSNTALHSHNRLQRRLEHKIIVSIDMRQNYTSAPRGCHMKRMQ